MGSQIVAIVASRAHGLGALFAEGLERAELEQLMPSSVLGWGFGFYHAGEILHRKQRVLPGQDVSLAMIAGTARSHCAIAHLFKSARGEFDPERVPPFRIGQWLYSQTTNSSGADGVRDRVLENLPDFLRRNVRSATLEEVTGHLVLAEIHYRGQLEVPRVQPEIVVEAIRDAAAKVQKLWSAAHEGATLGAALVLAQGDYLFASAWGDGVLSVREPVRRASRPPLAGDRPPPFVVVAGGVVPDPERWRSLKPGEIAIVDNNATVAYA